MSAPLRWWESILIVAKGPENGCLPGYMRHLLILVHFTNHCSNLEDWFDTYGHALSKGISIHVLKKKK